MLIEVNMKYLNIIIILMFSVKFASGQEIIELHVKTAENQKEMQAELVKFLEKNPKTVVMISSTSCVSCPDSYKGFKEVAKNYADKKEVQFIKVQIEYTKDELTGRYAKEEGLLAELGSGYPKFHTFKSSALVASSNFSRNSRDYDFQYMVCPQKEIKSNLELRKSWYLVGKHRTECLLENFEITNDELIKRPGFSNVFEEATDALEQMKSLRDEKNKLPEDLKVHDSSEDSSKKPSVKSSDDKKSNESARMK